MVSARVRHLVYCVIDVLSLQDVYSSPVVSVLCWHVFCQQCWLKALSTQKLCPTCKTITCPGDLRRIFL